MVNMDLAALINLPTEGEPTHRAPVDRTVLREAIRAGNELGFVDRDPSARRKPGPKRTELQGKVFDPWAEAYYRPISGFLY